MQYSPTPVISSPRDTFSSELNSIAVPHFPGIAIPTQFDSALDNPQFEFLDGTSQDVISVHDSTLEGTCYTMDSTKFFNTLCIIDSLPDYSSLSHEDFTFSDGLARSSSFSIAVPFNTENFTVPNDDFVSSLPDVTHPYQNSTEDSSGCSSEVVFSPSSLFNGISVNPCNRSQLKRRYTECGKLSRSRMRELPKIGMKRSKCSFLKPLRFDSCFGEVYACSSDNACTFVFSRKHMEFC